MRIDWREFRELLLSLVTFWIMVASWVLLIVSIATSGTLVLQIVAGILAVLSTLVLVAFYSS